MSGGGGWWNLTPTEYAKGLRFGAERSGESAARMRAQGRTYSEHDAHHLERQARRLRAMALLCDVAKCATAGAVDFLGMANPGQGEAAEAWAINQAHAIAKATDAQ